MLEPSKHSSEPGISANYAPRFETLRFERARWVHCGVHIDRFFDAFVPSQYENGFAWRSRVIGRGEEKRIIPFEEQPGNVKKIIAANAEVLLELYQSTKPQDLDRMREAGRKIVEQGIVDPDRHVEGDIPELREQMSRMHHEKWLAQFHADIASGKRNDRDHRGAKPYDELPPIELTVMKVQTWGNWRILARLSDDEYAMLRVFSSP